MRFILVHWKEGDKLEAYRTLTSFLANNPDHGFNYYTIDHYIGRNQTPYVDDLVTIRRLEIIDKPSKIGQKQAHSIRKKAKKSVKSSMKL